MPLDALAAVGLDVTALSAPAASPELLACISGLAGRNAELLRHSAAFSAGIVDFRLALEVAAIQRLGEGLNGLLLSRDPLSQRVHFGKRQFMLIALAAAAGCVWHRLGRGFGPPKGIVDNA